MYKPQGGTRWTVLAKSTLHPPVSCAEMHLLLCPEGPW